MDATHVLCERIPHDRKNEHEAFKLAGTACTYNLIVMNQCRILSSTRGHPARYNDKTLVRYDQLAFSLWRGTTELDSMEFSLQEKDSNGEVVSVMYRGAWLLVDNGYLNWSCTVPPMKTTISYAELRFSKWLESLRKDVECTFGILKGRFRVLKAGVRLHGIEAVDKLWLTCCAMHNMFLEADGLDSAEAYLGEEGQFTMEDVEEAIPIALQRLLNPGQLRLLDTSGIGRASGQDGDVPEEEDYNDMRPMEQQLQDCLDSEGFQRVRLLSLEVFRSKLVEHFDIQYHANKLEWPKSLVTHTK
jgi:hypothetical protein